MNPDEQVNEQQLCPSFANLPHYVLCNIFSNLCTAEVARAGCVCIQWYHASKDASLWKIVHVNSLDLTADRVEKLLPCLPSCTSYLRLQCLKCLRKQTDPIFTAANSHILKKNCHNLKTLIIENALLVTYNGEMDFTAKDLPINLEVLSLRGSIFNKFFFTDGINYNNFKVVDLTGCVCVNDYVFLLCRYMFNLEELYLAGCPLSTHEVRKLFNEMEACGSTHNKKFKHQVKLKIIDLEGTNIEVDEVLCMEHNLTSLEQLFVSRTSIMEDRERYRYFQNVSPNYPSLHTICLQHVKLNSLILSTLSKMKSLKCIKLAACDASIINSLKDVDVGLKEKIEFIDMECSPHCNHFMKRESYF